MELLYGKDGNLKGVHVGTATVKSVMYCGPGEHSKEFISVDVAGEGGEGPVVTAYLSINQALELSTRITRAIGDRHE